uniref:Proteophosphoglycan ppg4 n=1 Tax=Haemonchus contortus TaxID=6289 RepID=A0A7I4YL93_HAECO
MKAPDTTSRCPSRTEAAASPVPSRQFPHNFVKVHEGADVENKKPYLGRVLDGPPVLSPEKFYQGVMPTSLLQNHSVVPAPTPTLDTKPPSPMPKPKYSKRNSFINRLARESSPTESHEFVQNEVPQQSEQQQKLSNVALGEERNQLAEVGEASKNAQPSLPTQELPTTNPPRSALFTEKSFDTVFQTGAASVDNDRQVTGALKSSTSMKDDRQNGLPENRMPDLLKSRSPAPFSYSVSPNAEIFSPATVQDLTNSLNEALANLAKTPPASNVTSDSGYDGDGTLQQTPQDHTPRAEQSFSDRKFDNVPESAGNWSRSVHEQASSVTQTSSEGGRLASQESQQKGSELPASSVAIAASAEPTMYDKFLAGPSSHTPEMSLWYRNMFKKMHKIESPSESSILRHRFREESPAPTISRPLTPLTFTARSPSRHECEVTPRRAKSVGRIIEPEMLANSRRNSANLFALEKSRTTHFHLPSYKFAHEDSRPIVSDCRPGLQGTSRCGVRCLRCGLRRKDPSWTEIEAIVNSLAPSHDRSFNNQRHIQSKIALRCITENLDDTAQELSQFIQRLEQFWNRSSSTPQLSVCGEGGSTSTTAEDIAELKRISKEELLYRQKAERLAEELQEQRNRRHGYIPTASPSLVGNKDRFGGLLEEYSRRTSPSPMHPMAVRTATVLFKFDAKSPKELSLNRGDVVRIRRDVDANWLEGERNGQSGLFPRSYVQLDDEFDRSRCKAKAIYPFTARRATELSLKMGELVTLRREIDENWLEGTNHLGEIGIFPRTYIRFLEDIQDDVNESVQNDPLAYSPDRPKTPKIYDRNAYRDPFDMSSVVHNLEPSSSSRDSGFIENRLSQTSSTARQTASEESSNNRTSGNVRSEGYLCTADKIPRGSQTYRALYPYTPMKDDEVALEVNDIIFVVEKCDDGWYIGTVLRTGQFGTFPGNYVERH